MKATRKLKEFEHQTVNATLNDGPQEYVGVLNENGQLLAWGLKRLADKGEWGWIRKDFRRG